MRHVESASTTEPSAAPSRLLLIATCFMVLGACGDDGKSGADVYPDGVAQAGFGRPCTADYQCEANACVPHIGDTVCSQLCDPDNPCPDDWTCWTPPATAEAEVHAFCVSPYWSLCRPCSSDADCSSLADDDPGECINYNDSGTFCGTDCTDDGDCPDGFACDDVQTRSGRQVRQCVNTTGMCECSSYVAGLGEATRCAVENEWGRCHGERTCDSKLWSRCDAKTPSPDAPNQIDDDCDGQTDELQCLCGDQVCDGACGETLANCPCDCAAQGDGVCSPCGESPNTSPVDCCRGPGGTAGCGDGFCIGFGCGENPATCPQDCSTPCGNELCEPGENPFNCAEDCKHEVCGNNICESSDGGPEACPQDCDAYCGDCECEVVRDESVFNCAIDCGYCGDGSCSTCAALNEDATTCAADCCTPSQEACNGVDDDCDGETDEADAIGCRIFYRDEDGDELGRWDDARCLCAAAGAWGAAVLGDCDDADGGIGLGGEEACNDQDDDCDGTADEGFDLGTPCAAPGGACVSGVVACDGPDRTACVDGPAMIKGTVCRELACRDGIIHPPSLCDGGGSCVALPLSHCEGYLCDESGRCEADCASDSDCREGYACGATGACELDDTPCTADSECIDEDWATTDFCLIVCGHGDREGELPSGDRDGDGVANAADLCPETSDPGQGDSDGDGRGDACDKCEGAGSAESCNGRDDDCDGQTDEGFGVGVSCVADGAACRVGVRVCNAQGTTSCPATGDAPPGLACGDAACVGDDLRLASRCDGAGTCTPGNIVACQGFTCAPRTPATGGPICADDCAADDDCAAGYHCAATPAGGACAPDLANGVPCGSDGQCASDMCIDGVCCATDCAGGCFTCGSAAAPGQCVPVAANTDPKSACGPCAMCNAAGACANVAAGPSPKNACPSEPPCGTTGLCDNAGQCRVAAAGTSCSSATCNNGTLTAGTTCDGIGACRDATTSVCAGDLLCADATTCLARCTTDRDCRVGNFCDASGACLDLRALGQTCSVDRMCASGICADGLCCDGRCTGLCESCATAQAPGKCTPHPTGQDPEEDCGECGTCNAGACVAHAAGTDPDDDCVVRAPCAQTGMCDGNFGCAAAANTTACGDGACVGTALVSARLCDGTGSCNSPTITACVAYRCDDAGAACRSACSSDDHCQGGFFCGNNQCLPKLAKGASCTAASACISGICSDNRCCDSACSDLCETCNSPGTAGTCTPLDNQTDGACSGELICESGDCKYNNGVACGAGTECASGFCADDVCCPSACSGACQTCESGTCQPIVSALYPDECAAGAWCGAAQTCEPILGAVCSANPGCPDGFICKSGLCALPAPLGTACAIDSECASGQCTDGVCCQSDCIGTCRRCKANGLCENLPAGSEEAGDCPSVSTTCAADGSCKNITGGTCAVNADCANGRCVDNRCCPEVCGGECRSCASGVCLPVSHPVTDLTTCPAPGQCADGNCVNTTNGACAVDGDCASNECIPFTSGGAIGFCCATACAGECKSCVLSGDGTCTDVVAAENPGICSGTKWCNAAKACVNKIGMSCGVEAPCADGTWCSAGSCQPLAVLGELCETNASCANGLPCVDGRCCENSCAGECESCSIAGSLGRCEPLENFANDAMCVGGEVCSRAANGCAFGQGHSCNSDPECASGYCVDNVCCDRACDGACDACNGAVDGVCGTIANDEAPRCGGDFACNAAGTCSLAAGRPCFDDSDCASGSCSPAGVCCAVGCTGPCDSCELDGSCVEVVKDENFERCDETHWCVPGAPQEPAICIAKGHACAGGDADCAPDYYCEAGTCTPDKGLGEHCTGDGADNVDSECASGWCAGGFCCESECHGVCETCRFEDWPGVCLTAEPGEDPSDLCGPGETCNGPLIDGDCGFDNGRACTEDFECASGNCDAGTCCSKACDGICERCKADGLGCEAVSSGPDFATCPAPRACAGAGVCKKGLGEACAQTSDCASGACGDTTVGPGFIGVCCSTACNDACETCNPVTGICEQIFLQDDDERCVDGDKWCDKYGDCRLETGSECGNDTQCPDAFFCSTLTSRCERKRVGGSACTLENGSECDTGFCANGRCCQAPCAGPCDTCDPGGICRLDPPETKGDCSAALACNRVGECKSPKGAVCVGGLDCASGHCVENPSTGERICTDTACTGLCEAPDLTGTCLPLESGSDEACNAPFECAGRNRCLLQLAEACGQNASCASGICEDDICCSQLCAPGSHCQGGACALDQVAGTICEVDGQCSSGFCVNGNCCNRDCGRCETCNPAGWSACTSVVNATTTTCSDGMICDVSAQCVPARVEISNNVTGNATQALGATANVDHVGQSFFVATTFTADRVGMAIGRPSFATGNFEYRLYAAGVDGEPTGAILAKTNLLTATSLPPVAPSTIANPTTFSLQTPVSLVGGQSYVLVAHDLGLSDSVQVDVNLTEPYAGGRAGFASVTPATYSPQNSDARFVVSGTK